MGKGCFFSSSSVMPLRASMPFEIRCSSSCLRMAASQLFYMGKYFKSDEGQRETSCGLYWQANSKIHPNSLNTDIKLHFVKIKSVVFFVPAFFFYSTMMSD